MNFSGKKIVVTGGTGHVGQFLLKKLDSLDVNVVALSRTENTLNFLNNTRFVYCDISNSDSVKKIRRYLNKADYLIHLAAFVPKGSDDKLKNNIVNVEGTKNLVQYIGKQTKVCYASTAEVYGNTVYTPIDEKHPCHPSTYYGKSKLIAEDYLKSSLKKKGNDLVIFRFAGIYGPGEVIPRAIPNFVSSVLSNKRPVIYGDGTDKRDFLYIDDAVNAILCDLKNWKNGTYNIASGKNYMIIEIANMVEEISGNKLKLRFEKPRKPKNNFIYNINKAKKNLNFFSKVPIKEGLKNEVIWKLINDSETVYVDFDGTLVDVNEKLYRLHKDSMEHFGLRTMPKEKYLNLKRKSMRESLVVGKIRNFSGYNRFRISMIEDRAYLKYDKLHANNVVVLKKLKHCGNLVLVTNRKNMQNLLWQMKKLKIHALFDDIIISREKISKNKSIVISDTENDILMGKKLNIPVISVENGIRSRDFLIKYNPRYLIKSFSWLDLIL